MTREAGGVGSLIQRIPDQHSVSDNRLLSIRRTCDVSLAVLLCRNLEVKLVVLRTNPARLRQRVAVLGDPIEADVGG